MLGHAFSPRVSKTLRAHPDIKGIFAVSGDPAAQPGVELSGGLQKFAKMPG